MATGVKQKKERLRLQLTIESLNDEGQGVGWYEGQPYLVHGALPGELITAEVYGRTRGHLLARLIEVNCSSPDRVTPPCEYAGYCAACVWQHVAVDAQIRQKQTMVADLFKAQGLTVKSWAPPICAESTHYRQRARLSVKWVPKKGGCLIGFRELHSGRHIADIQSCRVIDQRLGLAIDDLRTCVRSLSIPDRIPQVEWICTPDHAALIVRHLDPLSDTDKHNLIEFGKAYQVAIWLQPKGLDSMVPLWGEQAFYYDHDAFNVRLFFAPQHFTQINHAVNRLMVIRAVEWLDCQPTDKMLDLFCGIGNFSLPFATRVQDVIGIEGDEGSVAMATANAQRENCSNATFIVEDLLDPPKDATWLSQRFDKICIDPPRSGAPGLMPLLPKLNAQKILYVACEPRTLATDAAILQSNGYALTRACVIDMFPHTRHVETMILFEKDS